MRSVVAFFFITFAGCFTTGMGRYAPRPAAGYYGGAGYGYAYGGGSEFAGGSLDPSMHDAIRAADATRIAYERSQYVAAPPPPPPSQGGETTASSDIQADVRAIAGEVVDQGRRLDRADIP